MQAFAVCIYPKTRFCMERPIWAFSLCICPKDTFLHNKDNMPYHIKNLESSPLVVKSYVHKYTNIICLFTLIFIVLFWFCKIYLCIYIYAYNSDIKILFHDLWICNYLLHTCISLNTFPPFLLRLISFTKTMQVTTLYFFFSFFFKRLISIFLYTRIFNSLLFVILLFFSLSYKI